MKRQQSRLFRIPVRLPRTTRTATATATTAALLLAGAVAAGVSGSPSPAHAAPAGAHAAPAGAEAVTAAGEARPGGGRPGERQIAALFDHWNTALLSGDAERVADLYAPDAVLLPTASPRIRTTHDGIVDYFEHFLRKKPEGSKVRTVVKVLDADSAVDAGLYRFAVTDPVTGEPGTIEARYSFEYEKRGGRWLIVHHHSSVVPREG